MSKTLKILTDNWNKNLHDATWLSSRTNKLNILLATDKNFDLILLTGGEDVHPTLYQEKDIGMRTFTNEYRDLECIKLWNIARTLNKPIIGICRGAQFITAMAGGKLIQHVTNHAGTHHYIRNNHGVIFDANSSHHQMMYPFELKKDAYDILAYAAPAKSTKYLNGKNEMMRIPENFVEPEIILYKKQKALAIQGHPEWLHINHEFSVLCRRIAQKTVLKELI